MKMCHYLTFAHSFDTGAFCSKNETEMIFRLFSTKKAKNSFGKVFLVLKKHEVLKFFNILALKKSAQTCARIFSAKKCRPSFF